MYRRRVLGLFLTGILVPVTGCLNENGSSNSPTGTEQRTQCRTVQREESRTVYDQLKTWDAGSSLTWDFDLQEGEQVSVKAVKIDGARPDLEVQNPDGEHLIDTSPTENIERRFTASRDATYYVKISNEAMLTSGQWDVTVELTRTVEEEVCT